MFLYRVNETMRMLGHQCPMGLVSFDGIAAKDFENLIDAHRKNRTYSLFDFGIDAFMLGYIYGKRAERSKQKKKRQSLNFGE